MERTVRSHISKIFKGLNPCKYEGKACSYYENRGDNLNCFLHSEKAEATIFNSNLFKTQDTGTLHLDDCVQKSTYDMDLHYFRLCGCVYDSNYRYKQNH